MNRVILTGNLTADPVRTDTPSGIAMTRFTIAVSRRSSKDETDFFNVTCWRQSAEFAANNLTKGRKVGVVGSVQIRKYQDKDGVNRQAIDIIADEVEALSPRADNGTAGESQKPAPAGLVAEEQTSDEGLPF